MRYRFSSSPSVYAEALFGLNHYFTVENSTYSNFVIDLGATFGYGDLINLTNCHFRGLCN